jgi:hypothetical protein
MYTLARTGSKVKQNFLARAKPKKYGFTYILPTQESSNYTLVHYILGIHCGKTPL